ncbi:MAG: GNAT family N-acetyltransferase [Bryobacteraceae bacterium]
MAGRETIRQLTQNHEFSEAVKLQKAIWGFDDIDLLPVRLFITASKIGGHSFGAYDGDRMVGFCVAIPGIKQGAKSYLHSHMLGVTKEYRDAGLGRKLKMAQRDDAIKQGIDLIEWTFDPLEIKNAFFNIERLGAIVRRFVLNQYGTTSSPLNAGLPTDRCTAEWWLQSDRVEGRETKRPEVVARISITNDIYKIKANDFARAREIQMRVADQFLEYFAKNLAVTGFERSAENGTYLLSPWESK